MNKIFLTLSFLMGLVVLASNYLVQFPIKYYGLEEGKIISYVDRTTPTRGRELTVLQQLFGNLGRLGAGNLPGN